MQGEPLVGSVRDPRRGTASIPLTQVGAGGGKIGAGSSRESMVVNHDGLLEIHTGKAASLH